MEEEEEEVVEVIKMLSRMMGMELLTFQQLSSHLRLWNRQ